jgi:magnesium-transporting ATPase (P-type)
MESGDVPGDESVERDLVFLGLVGMMDAPRADAIQALSNCREAGIHAVMITGDHKLTATAVAAEMGLMQEGDEARTGEDVEAMSDAELLDAVERIRVYARVSPHHKVRIVNAWREKGHVVAMTGDGVNDAPALRRADIGVAMGVTGTDVAKEAADMVLTDDNFASIVQAVQEGRGIFDNIRKFVGYLLSANAGELMVMFSATILLGRPEFLPFLFPIQILWINLVTDGLPALALGVDPVEEDVMKRPPRPPRESPLNRTVVFGVLMVGGLLTVGSFLLYLWESSNGAGDAERIRTSVFTMIVVFELLFVFSIRALHTPLHRSKPFSNPWLVVAVLASLLLQLMVLYIPSLQGLFKVEPLGAMGWLRIIVVCTGLMTAFEIWKAVFLRRIAR